MNCISDDSKGYFAYESVIHSIEETKSILPTIDGYLFMHDDVVWDENISFNSMISRVSKIWQLSTDLGCDWIWGEYGYTAINSFNSLSGLHLPNENEQIYIGNADFYFISQNDASTFQRIALLMRKNRLWLEIAVPMFIKYFSQNPNTGLNSPLKLLLGTSNVDQNFKKDCNGRETFDCVHPVKINSYYNFERSLYCDETLF